MFVDWLAPCEPVSGRVGSGLSLQPTPMSHLMARGEANHFSQLSLIPFGHRFQSMQLSFSTQSQIASCIHSSLTGWSTVVRVGYASMRNPNRASLGSPLNIIPTFRVIIHFFSLGSSGRVINTLLPRHPSLLGSYHNTHYDRPRGSPAEKGMRTPKKVASHDPVAAPEDT